MVNSFQSFLKKEKLIKSSDTVLLTVSGGIDSVVLCELFYQTKIKFAIAHCNFQLRGKESEGDELFVEALAEKYNVPFHTISFETSSYAKKHKLSIQVAARDLRYAWFEEIRQQYNYARIATAHHQDDSIETFFINLIRGTGIKGLHGILPMQGNLIRPLLFANKKEIIAFAKKNKLKHREDSSNASDKYVRNKIRHSLIPLLNEINKSASVNIITTIENLKSVEAVYQKRIDKKRTSLIIEEKGIVKIAISKLKKLNPIEPYLFELLYPLGFSSIVVDEIISALGSESGKQFFSETHRLVKDREFLLIEEIGDKTKELDSRFKILKSTKELPYWNKTLVFKSIKRTAKLQLVNPAAIAQFDFEKLVFPLTLRKWEKGDVFYPIGMKGKKKLSDYFIDKKLSLLEKENSWVLESNGTIIWVVGQRMDDRYKITATTKKIYFAELMK
jgi:tRNA(Ile)-lysidine synthase